MAVGVNRVVLIGNLTKDVELRYTAGENPTAVAGIRLAVNGRERVGGVWQDRADYFDVRVWGNQAESCSQRLAKGSKIAVDGRLRMEEWEDRDTKQKRSRVLVVASNVQFIERYQGGGSSSPGAEVIPDGEFTAPQADFSSEVGAGHSDDPDSDIPF